MTIAALFVDPKGIYSTFANIELWDEIKDARKYPGPYPVIAHPPCTRWCKLAGLVEAKYGYKRREDGGCFESALKNVRKWGGVLEHPAYSDAWKAYELGRPHPYGGWQPADFQGGWTCYIEQGRYGHIAKKATWLYAVAPNLRSLDWGISADNQSKALVSWCGNKTKKFDKRKRVSKKAASSTPRAFAEILIDIANSCNQDHAMY